MLNVLRLSQKPERPATVWYVSAAIGFLLGLGWTVWQAQLAVLSMPLLLQEKRQWEGVLNQVQPTQSDLEGLQFALTQATQRVQALEKRQSMRIDLEEVQALLFDKTQLRNRNQIRMEKLRWQGGHFEWEGSSLSSEALQALLMQTNSFDRWHTQPKLVQVQSASALVPSLTVAPASGQKPVAQSMVFKLEGQIEADLSNLPWVSQQP